MHNVTLRRVRPTVVAVIKRKELDISSVVFLPYPARKPHFFFGGGGGGVRIILSYVAYPALPYFSTSSHKRHDFRKKVPEHKMFILISSTIFI